MIKLVLGGIRDTIMSEHEMSQLARAKRKKSQTLNQPAWYMPVTDSLLRDITQRIVEACDPEKVVLFGSYAYGQPTPRSDLDLLVVMRTRKSMFERHKQISKLFPHRLFSLDILVRTPTELAHRLYIQDAFFREIITHGRVLYERGTGSGMGSQGRGRLRKRTSLGALAQKTASG